MITVTGRRKLKRGSQEPVDDIQHSFNEKSIHNIPRRRTRAAQLLGDRWVCYVLEVNEPFLQSILFERASCRRRDLFTR